MNDNEQKAPDSLAVRSQRHRQRKKNMEVQLAVGIAKLVSGRDLGDHRLVLKEYLSRFSSTDELPDDQLRIVDQALDRLNQSRLRL